MSKAKTLFGVMTSVMFFYGLVGCGMGTVSQTGDMQGSQEESLTMAEKDNNHENETEELPMGTDDGYTLMWEDNFDETALNADDWNIELHDPGWVNNELQEYVNSDDNIFIEDGMLVIQALKHTDADGNVTYTSGRVNTQNKHDFKYGKFEVRAKVPSGKGFLPAFWMMPTDENLYGQWPKCGEIDIMEVLGDSTDTTYSTLHFGEPHTQKQGSLTLDNGDFSEEFHVFSCEWEPGQMRFYVDNQLIFEENDWFTKKQGFGEVTYPAPYDQPFYIILNLAVGGTWPGNPDDTTAFEENARLTVDYVRVYQKDSYDEEVEKPEKALILREPDETGNYIVNGDFADTGIGKGEVWEFLTAGEGKAEAEIKEQELHIITEDAGELDYSVQFVQPNIPMEKGCQYQLSFDAYALESRIMKTAVTAPDNGYIRYFEDTIVELTPEKQHYTYIFDMTDDSDANGRLEFNLGNQNATAEVVISGIRIEKLKSQESLGIDKTILPDGNYVYNGSFSEGAGRLAYWEVRNDCGAKTAVSNQNNIREFVVENSAENIALDAIQLIQSDIAITGDKDYILSFTAYADSDKQVKVTIAQQEFDIRLTEAKQSFKYAIHTDASVKDGTLCFLLGVQGTVCIDDVRLQEDGMLINGDFSSGLTGYEVYVNESANVSYTVDSLNEDSAASFDISNTGDQDWMVQLKQNGITLEEGHWYKIKFEAKASIDRKLMYALQRDGSSDDNWIPYSESNIVELTNEYQSFEKIFQMTNPTDENVILSISMGAVDGTQIKDKHTICVDRITLEEVEKN